MFAIRIKKTKLLIESSIKLRELTFWLSKGINSNRIKYRGYGETKPLTTNTSNNGRALNRRVEFIVK